MNQQDEMEAGCSKRNADRSLNQEPIPGPSGVSSAKDLQKESWNTLINWLELHDMNFISKNRVIVKQRINFGNAIPSISASDSSFLNEIEEVTLLFNERVFHDARRRAHTYEHFLKRCVNLISLNIDGDFVDDCLAQPYIGLERLQLWYNSAFKFDNLNKFFKLNSYVKNLSINGSCILYNRQSLINSDIKLNDLTIYGIQFDFCYIDILNRLYQRGFYKRLHVYAKSIPMKNKLTALKGLFTLYMSLNNYSEPVLPAITNLAELGFDGDLMKFGSTKLKINNIITLYNSIERLFMKVASQQIILPFICHLKKLNQIDITLFDESIVDLYALENARKQLDGAQKVTIYVPKDVYLATKVTTMNSHFNLIELQSSDPPTLHGLKSQMEYFDWKN